MSFQESRYTFIFWPVNEHTKNKALVHLVFLRAAPDLLSPCFNVNLGLDEIRLEDASLCSRQDSTFLSITTSGIFFSHMQIGQQDGTKRSYGIPFTRVLDFSAPTKVIHFVLALWNCLRYGSVSCVSQLLLMILTGRKSWAPGFCS